MNHREMSVDQLVERCADSYAQDCLNELARRAKIRNSVDHEIDFEKTTLNGQGLLEWKEEADKWQKIAQYNLREYKNWKEISNQNLKSVKNLEKELDKWKAIAESRPASFEEVWKVMSRGCNSFRKDEVRADYNECYPPQQDEDDPVELLRPYIISNIERVGTKNIMLALLAKIKERLNET